MTIGTTRNMFGKKLAHAALTFMLAGTMLAALSACGGTTATPTSGTSGAGTTPTQPAGATDTGGAASATMAPDAGGAAATTAPSTGGAAAPTTAPGTGSTAATPATTDTTGSGSSASGQSAGDATVVQGTLREWAIDLSQKDAPAGKVRFVVNNTSQMRHNFTVTDSNGTIKATPNFNNGDGPQTLEVDLKPGTYTIICSLPGHAARGQKTVFTVK